MNRGAGLVGALLVTIAIPTTWSLALAAFLIRGGAIVFFVPIAVLPTAAGLGNALGPTLTSIAFGSMSTSTVLLAVGLVVGMIVALGLIGWLAAALEAEGIRIVAVDDESSGPRVVPIAPIGAGVAGRVLAARLIANVPLVISLVWAAIRLVNLTYVELTRPVDVGTPLFGRVLGGAPEVIAIVVLAWIAGQTVGAMAARAIVIDGYGPADAVRSALRASIRHPVRSAARFLIPTLVLGLVILPSVLAAAAAWSAVADVLHDPLDPIGILAAVLVFVALWATGLLLTSVVVAWRSAVWTVAAVDEKRTFGGSIGSRPGDWRPDGPSAKV